LEEHPTEFADLVGKRITDQSTKKDITGIRNELRVKARGNNNDEKPTQSNLEPDPTPKEADLESVEGVKEVVVSLSNEKRLEVVQSLAEVFTRDELQTLINSYETKLNELVGEEKEAA